MAQSTPPAIALELLSVNRTQSGNRSMTFGKLNEQGHAEVFLQYNEVTPAQSVELQSYALKLVFEPIAIAE